MAMSKQERQLLILLARIAKEDCHEPLQTEIDKRIKTVQRDAALRGESLDPTQ